MRLVVWTDPGVMEINYTWLPTWIGLNTPLQKELAALLSQACLGKPVNEDTLEVGHRIVVEFLCDKFKELSLFEYLDAIKYVGVRSDTP